MEELRQADDLISSIKKGKIVFRQLMGELKQGVVGWLECGAV